MATLQIIRTAPAKWSFEISSPLYGLDQAMRDFNAKKDIDLSDVSVGSNQYKELIVEYIKAKFDVTAHHNTSSTNSSEPPSIKVHLGQGRIRLDDHVSSLIFEIVDMPDTSDRLEFRLPYMADNEIQHNVLRFIDGERSQRYILSYSNNFSVVDTLFFK